jgi:hypothetical protein
MFGISLSGSKSKSKTTVDRTTAPVVPDWLVSAQQGQTANVLGLGARDPASFVAGPHGLQTQAASGAAALGGDSGWYDNLMGTKAPTVSAAGVFDNGLDQYFNPFLKNVKTSALADHDFAAGAQRAQETLDIADQDGFRGSGAALTRSMGDDARLRSRDSLGSGLDYQGWQSATGLASQDADRRQAAAVASAQLASQNNDFLARLGLDKATSDRANVGLQSQIGGELQGIDQAKTSAPLDLAAWVAQVYGNIGNNNLIGQHETGLTKTKGSTIGASASGGWGK